MGNLDCSRKPRAPLARSDCGNIVTVRNKCFKQIGIDVLRVQILQCNKADKHYVHSEHTNFAGTPTYVPETPMLLTTTAPAPMTTSEQIERLLLTTAPMPIQVLLSTATEPARCAPTEICEKSPITQSWSTLADVFTMHPRPILTEGLITAPAITAVPSPITTSCATTADG